MRALLAFLLGAALGAAGVYLLLPRVPPAGTDPAREEALTASSGSGLLDRVRAALLDLRIPLYPGAPLDGGGPPPHLWPEGSTDPSSLPVWWGPVPADSSLLRLNALVTRAARGAGGMVLGGEEVAPPSSGRTPGPRAVPEQMPPIPYRSVVPGSDPEAALWLSLGSPGNPRFYICLKKMGAS